LISVSVDLKPEQAAPSYRVVMGAATKPPDCGSGSCPQKPSQTPFISKYADFLDLVPSWVVGDFGEKAVNLGERKFKGEVG